MHQQSSVPLRMSQILLALAILAFVFAAAGCGDGHSTFVASNPTNPTPSPTPTPVPTSTVQLRVGDAPADQVIDFEVTLVSPVLATLADGTKINATLANNRMELSHTAGKLEPLGSLTLPQGSYKSVDITLADPAITYVYTPAEREFAAPNGSLTRHELVSKDFPGTQTVTLTFNPPVNVGADATVLNLDVNIAYALLFSPDDKQEIVGVEFTPDCFNLIQKPIASADKQQHMDGELESVWGVASKVNGSSFTLTGGQSGVVLNITTTSTTQFHDSLKGIADVAGRLVEVEGYTQADGTMTANEIDLLAGSNGAGIEGVVLDAGNSLVDTNVFSFGHLPDSFTMLAQDGTGNGTRNDDVGWTFTIHTEYLTDSAYQVDYGKCDWSTLNTDVPGPIFPFDSRHIFPGQRVAVVTSSAVPDADFSHFSATGVFLEQQAITGKIVFYHAPETPRDSALPSLPDDSTWFVLELPRDSYVRSLSGRSQVLVYQSPSAEVEFLSTNAEKTIGEGTLVRVRGLMFAYANWYPQGAPTIVSHDGNILTMIARRITEQQPPIAEPLRAH